MKTQPIPLNPPSDVKENPIVSEILISEIGQDRTFCYRGSDKPDGALKENIQLFGLKNPLKVEKTSTGYRIISGFRRFHALKELGWKSVTALVVTLNHLDSRTLSILDNIHQKSFGVWEMALTIKKLREEEWSFPTIATLFGKSLSTIEKYGALFKISNLSLIEAVKKGKCDLFKANYLNSLSETLRVHYPENKTWEKGAFIQWVLEKGFSRNKIKSLLTPPQFNQPDFPEPKSLNERACREALIWLRDKMVVYEKYLRDSSIIG